MTVDLRLDEDEVDEEHDEVMLDVFVGEALAAGALGEADAFAGGAVVGFAVGRVELVDGVTAFYADHGMVGDVMGVL